MTARSTAILFTRFGLGEAPADLQLRLAVNFLMLLEQVDEGPSALLFYGDGVKLVCEGSPVLELLRALESRGASLTSCRTCLEHFGLTDKVQVGQPGGMPAIVEAMTRADKVISV
jgi:hypothetical protein